MTVVVVGTPMSGVDFAAGSDGGAGGEIVVDVGTGVVGTEVVGTEVVADIVVAEIFVGTSGAAVAGVAAAIVATAVVAAAVAGTSVALGCTTLRSGATLSATVVTGAGTRGGAAPARHPAPESPPSATARASTVRA